MTIVIIGCDSFIVLHKLPNELGWVPRQQFDEASSGDYMNYYL